MTNVNERLLDKRDIVNRIIKYSIFGVTLTMVVHLITKEILTGEQLMLILIVSTLIYGTMDFYL